MQSSRDRSGSGCGSADRHPVCRSRQIEAGSTRRSPAAAATATATTTCGGYALKRRAPPAIDQQLLARASPKLTGYSAGRFCEQPSACTSSAGSRMQHESGLKGGVGSEEGDHDHDHDDWVDVRDVLPVWSLEEAAASSSSSSSTETGASPIDIQVRNVVSSFTVHCHVDLQKMAHNTCDVYYERSKGVSSSLCRLFRHKLY